MMKMSNKKETKQIDAFSLKKKWLLNNGFRIYKSKGTTYYELTGTSYSEEQVRNTSMIVFMKLKEYKDGKITFEEFKEIKNKAKAIRERCS